MASPEAAVVIPRRIIPARKINKHGSHALDMGIGRLLGEKFVIIVEIHPQKHPAGGCAERDPRLSVIDKALHLRRYADIITVTESTSPEYSHSTLETVRLLREHAGIEVIPHLTLRLHTPESIPGLLAECREMGITSLFVVRGDDFAPRVGSYSYASEMIGHISEAQQGISVGAACNPHARKEQELRSVMEKVQSGASYLISQPVFSVEHYLCYVGWLRSHGIGIPVIPGIMPLKSRKTIEFIEKSIKEITIPEDVKELHLAADDTRAACIRFNRGLILGLMGAGAPGIDLFSRGDVALTGEILLAVAEADAGKRILKAEVGCAALPSKAESVADHP